MADGTYNVLFLCTGNSARSILAEALLNALGNGRFKAYSAGSHPVGDVNPLALQLLQEKRLPTAGLRSKSWDEFARSGAPEFDFVITVCASAAGETCPVWPGRPISAHWGVDDPAAVKGTDDDKRRAFKTAFDVLESRIKAFTRLRLESLDALSLKAQLSELGKAPSQEKQNERTGRNGDGTGDDANDGVFRALAHGVGGAVHRGRRRARAGAARRVPDARTP